MVGVGGHVAGHSSRQMCCTGALINGVHHRCGAPSTTLQSHMQWLLKAHQCCTRSHPGAQLSQSLRQAGMLPLLRLAIVVTVAEAQILQSFGGALCRGAHRCCAWLLCCGCSRCRLGLVLVPMPEATSLWALLGLNGPRYALRLGSQAHALNKPATGRCLKSSSSPGTHNKLDKMW